MKLVEILASELSEWPLGGEYAEQDKDREVRFSGDVSNCDFFASVLADEDKDVSCSDGIPYAGRVTRSQWQAERDRQKGGEWKRHRGGKQPLENRVSVECKLRCGDIQQGASDDFLWPHADCDVSVNIMQYRVISQPQAEEVEVRKLEGRDVRLEELMTGHRLPYEVHCGEVIHGPISMGDEVIAPAHPKWHQIDGPIKWRDTVNELDAYIEEFTREREALIERLASEGFALIPPVVSVMSEFSGVDMSDWRNWKAGDLVTSKTDYNGQFTKGKKYSVTATRESHGSPRVSLERDDKGKENGWVANNFEFHSRP